MIHVQCPTVACSAANSARSSKRIVRVGSYRRTSDCQRVSRFRCMNCRRSFSSERFAATYRQKKRRINHPVAQLLNSGVSQRRIALLLGVNRKTVVRKFRFLAEQARAEQARWRQATFSQHRLRSVQFDDLETSEHSKCKPLSVTLAVEPGTRKILDFQVSRMPARGPLAEIARRRYGRRHDERPVGWTALMRSLQPLVAPDAHWRSDQNPHYPFVLKRHFPQANHECVRSRRACVTGQGELKRGGFDPLFSLNHTCAMLRANLNRLFRRTWCTTKTKQGLIDHLSIYVSFHNHEVTPDYPA